MRTIVFIARLLASIVMASTSAALAALGRAASSAQGDWMVAVPCWMGAALLLAAAAYLITVRVRGL